MAQGRPGGNPNIADYGFKSDRRYPLTKTVNFRVDEPTKEALKNGKLPGWTKIARAAVEFALAQIEEEEQQQEQQQEQDLTKRGFLDGLRNKAPSRNDISKQEYIDGYSKGLIEYYKQLYEVSTNNNNKKVVSS